MCPLLWCGSHFDEKCSNVIYKAKQLFSFRLALEIVALQKTAANRDHLCWGNVHQNMLFTITKLAQTKCTYNDLLWFLIRACLTLSRGLIEQTFILVRCYLDNRKRQVEKPTLLRADNCSDRILFSSLYFCTREEKKILRPKVHKVNVM